MKTLTTDAEIDANGSVRLLTPLPAWVKPGRAGVSLLVEETEESLAEAAAHPADCCAGDD